MLAKGSLFEFAFTIYRSLLANICQTRQIQLTAYYQALLENPSGVRSLADLIKFNDANPDLEEPSRFEDQSE